MQTPLQALLLNTTAEQLSAALAATAQTNTEQYCAAAVDAIIQSADKHTLLSLGTGLSSVALLRDDPANVRFKWPKLSVCPPSSDCSV
eukprot:20334-Heterococcus_DN1.PRE.2